jgi:hypothetical protein
LLEVETTLDPEEVGDDTADDGTDGGDAVGDDTEDDNAAGDDVT